MGQVLTKAEFSEADYKAFSERLNRNLTALRQLMNDHPEFGKGPGSFGAELEFYLIDGEGNPLYKNREIMSRVNDPLLTLELNRFNLEYNLNPVALSRQPFITTENSLQEALGRIENHARAFGGRIVPIGILPTLRFDHFGPHAMTDEPRYHALKKRLQEIREGLFKVTISGADELLIETDDITFEGANTSFQTHYRVEPGDFAHTYNALQLITPLVLAVATNSPTAFGKRLWQETRVPLFKKSIDCRKEESLRASRWHLPSRVNYGQGWLREGAWELFAETVRLYPPLLPMVDEEDPLATLARGDIPRLSELRLHQGTVWLWNRPVYDHADGGHLRVEMRSLPSGPSVVDMVANAALAVGLVEGLKPDIQELLPALPFHYATHNFYRAAEFGLDARIIWPDLTGSSVGESPVLPVLQNLLPVAEQGLAHIGIGEDEIRKYLGVIEQRLERNITGASWQLAGYEKLRRHMDDAGALHRLLELYYEQSCKNIPVSRWETP